MKITKRLAGTVAQLKGLKDSAETISQLWVN
jgi:hypothetical protein